MNIFIFQTIIILHPKILESLFNVYKEQLSLQFMSLNYLDLISKIENNFILNTNLYYK